MKPKSLLSALAAGALGVSAIASAQMVDGVGSPAMPQSASAPVSRITAEQRAMLNEKLELVRQIVQSAETDMRINAVPKEGRQSMIESLFAMSLGEVRAVGVPGTFDGTSKAIVRAKASAKAGVLPKLGGLTTELVYLPITPCRYIDTRFGGGGIVSGTRQFDLDTAGSSHGGSGACNPLNASGIGSGFSGQGAAIAMNVAILGPTVAPGFMGARPVGSTNTTSLVNWYEAGPTVQASNWGVVTYDQQGAVTNEIEFFGGPAHVIVDVFGIFAAPTATALDCTTVVDSGSGLVANNGAVTIGTRPACPAGYTIVSMACMKSGALTSGVSLVQVGPQEPTGAGWSACRWLNESGGNVDGADYRVASNCCRLPGR